jgi:hypothetical protein
LNFPKALADSEYNSPLLYVLIETFPGFAQNSLEKWQASNCHFSKNFLENPGRCLTIGKKVKYKSAYTKLMVSSGKELIISKKYIKGRVTINSWHTISKLKSL